MPKLVIWPAEEASCWAMDGNASHLVPQPSLHGELGCGGGGTSRAAPLVRTRQLRELSGRRPAPIAIECQALRATHRILSAKEAYAHAGERVESRELLLCKRLVGDFGWPPTGDGDASLLLGELPPPRFRGLWPKYSDTARGAKRSSCTSPANRH